MKTLSINLLVTILLFAVSCDDFVEIDPPRTSMVSSTVFTNETTAKAAVTDIYYKLSNGFANGGGNSVSLYCALTSDEVFYTSGVPTHQEFADNTLQAANLANASLWGELYQVIYKANSVIEGLSASTAVPKQVTDQLTGEAFFVRAFCHFYLVNLYGDIPLVLSTNYQENTVLPRTQSTLVYQQVITDLIKASDLLPETYAHGNGERVRANKGAALALLSRVYLFNNSWSDAEQAASAVIDMSVLYNLESDLSAVFNISSKEAILQLWCLQYPPDLMTFSVQASGPLQGVLRDGLLQSFEANDQRQSKWIRETTVGTTTYYSPLKYEQSFAGPPVKYSTLIRLAEIFLIRAEARAEQDKLTEAVSDLNLVRQRAGLPNVSPATRDQVIDAVIHERRVEFFTEWGHRWLDLKRTGQANAEVGPIKPEWSTNDLLFPIPETQIKNDPNMEQNPGY